MDPLMKVRPPRVLDPIVVTRIADHLRQGASLQNAISEMRSLGLNKIESMKLLRDHAGIALSKAKDLVHLSPAWSDRQESDERLHDIAEEALRMDIDQVASHR